MTGTHKTAPALLFTIDVEDWFQVENLRSAYPIGHWDTCELRVESNTQNLLDLLDVHGVKATFFVLGWVAERCGGLVVEIDRRGHEVASHGSGHQLCSGLTQEDLREDLYRSKSILEDLTGHAVYGYRAPSFSVTDRAITIMGELGYHYDSSYNSFSINKRHGRPDGLKASAGGQRTFANGIVELHVSNLTVGGRAVPWGGGGYFRFWPPGLFHRGVKQILKRERRYVFYCHPWEIDPGQPRVDDISFVNRYRHYKNIGSTMKRLDRFLAEFSDHDFVTCNRYLLDFDGKGRIG